MTSYPVGVAAVVFGRIGIQDAATRASALGFEHLDVSDMALANLDDDERARLALRGLSPREHEVLLAIARGRTNAEIAAELYMSVPTVKAHITHILTKLQLGNRTQIALLAHDADLA